MILFCLRISFYIFCYLCLILRLYGNNDGFWGKITAFLDSCTIFSIFSLSSGLTNDYLYNEDGDIISLRASLYLESCIGLPKPPKWSLLLGLLGLNGYYFNFKFFESRFGSSLLSEMIESFGIYSILMEGGFLYSVDIGLLMSSILIARLLLGPLWLWS